MKDVYAIGDTHGNNVPIKNFIQKYDIRNSIFIHVGDFGVGFMSKAGDEGSLNRLNSLLEITDNIMYVIRGNHDDPGYFNGEYKYSNLILVEDYTVIYDDILLVGGAISIDRKIRIEGKTYWKDEEFNYDEDLVSNLHGIKHVITHTAPSCATPRNTEGFPYIVNMFAENDETLKSDLLFERDMMNRMYEKLKVNNNIETWYYGHFHQSNTEYLDDTKFILLGINEVYDTKMQK